MMDGLPKEFIPGPEGSSAQPSSPQRLELLEAGNADLHIQLGEARVQLLYTQTCHQSEAHGRQSETQARLIIQRGLNAIQNTYFQLAASYKGAISRHDDVRAKLLEDIRLSTELAQHQQQLIELYEARDRQQQQQQQAANHDPYTPHNNYQQPGSQEFIMNPPRLPPLSDLNYNIGSSVEPSNTHAARPFAQFETHGPILPAPSHPTLAELSELTVPEDKGDDEKGEGGARPGKKRKIKATG